jgi:site-specific recombinase XerD
MNTSQQKRFDSLHRKHLSALRRQGKAAKTIDVYGRALRRITEYWDRCPDTLTVSQLETYFNDLVQTHSWSTVKVDRNGLQFFYQHVLKKDWQWVDIVKPPQRTTLPDILTQGEIERLINGTRELRYQTFILAAYSMGLRLSEVLQLQIKDIDSSRSQVHIRQSKGNKDRFVLLPTLTLQALRRYWASHRNPKWLFPAGQSAAERASATDRQPGSSQQQAFKAILLSCGIRKAATPHTLRHCYGAHLVEAGINLRAIQHQMGHESPKTTALYTQLTEQTQHDTGLRINALVNRLHIQWGA